ncbi:MAG TPA: hypothetical protein VGM98_22355 [Schlesneria sp.]
MVEIIVRRGRISHVHSIRDLLNEVRERPTLWLSAKSLTGLECLLGGYEMACSLHEIPTTKRLADDIPWEGFTHWLKQTYAKNHLSVGWHSIIVEQSVSEADAFDQFFSLLDEYERQCQEGRTRRST